MTSLAEYEEQWSAMQHLLWTPPLQRPGAVILHPKPDPTLRFDEGRRSVNGLPPDDYYLNLGGTGGPEPARSYLFGRSNVGTIVSGAYKDQQSDSRDLRIYEIVTARFGSAALSKDPDEKKFLVRSDFDFSKVAEYLEAYTRHWAAGRSVTTIVVDARDEHNKLRELRVAMDAAYREQRRKRLLAGIGK